MYMWHLKRTLNAPLMEDSCTVEGTINQHIQGSLETHIQVSVPATLVPTILRAATFACACAFGRATSARFCQFVRTSVCMCVRVYVHVSVCSRMSMCADVNALSHIIRVSRCEMFGSRACKICLMLTWEASALKTAPLSPQRQK